jgi:ABC-type proline/glycine betaine transport system permease subunit
MLNSLLFKACLLCDMMPVCACNGVIWDIMVAIRVQRTTKLTAKQFPQTKLYVIYSFGVWFMMLQTVSLFSAVSVVADRSTKCLKLASVRPRVC